MKKRKILILGLDGVPAELISDFVACGIMPNLASLLARGRRVPMTVSLPEISSVSWSSFLTGTDAGNHGIFGFVDLVPGTYRFRFPDFRDLRLPTFFDDLGQRKRRSVVINLPSTYPARPFPGALISGFIAPQLEKSVYPQSLLPVLKRMGYSTDVDATKGKDQKMEFLADLHSCLKVRKEVSDLLWDGGKWDLFMFTVTETDRLHHFLFDAWENPGHPFHEEFRQLYRELDAIIGDFCRRLEREPGHEIVLLSDHGFSAIRREVYINPILAKNRLYRNAPSEQKSLETIHPSTKAFAIDPARIFINLRGKFPAGSVDKQDYTKIRNDLRDLFERLSIDGERPVRQVYFKEEIYSPPLLDWAPDLVLVANPGSDLKAGIDKSVPCGLTHFGGMHRFDNAFFFCTRPEIIPDPMTIFDARRVIETLALGS